MLSFVPVNGEVRNNYNILWEGNVDAPHFPPTELTDVEQIDLGGEKEICIEYAVSNMERTGWITSYGLDRFGETTMDSIPLDFNTTYATSNTYAKLKLPPDYGWNAFEIIDFKGYLIVKHRVGGGKAEGVPPPSVPDHVSDIWEGLSHPIFSLWTQANITIEGIVSTFLVLGVGYIGIKLYRRIRKPRRRFRIKRVEFF